MEDWVVPLAIAVVGALATVAVGYLTYRQSRKDARDNLKRDIELFGLLPSEWASRESLRVYIEERVADLPVGEVVVRRFRTGMIMIVLATPILTGLIVYRDQLGMWRTLWYFFVIVAAFYLTRSLLKSHKKIRQLELKKRNLEGLSYEYDELAGRLTGLERAHQERELTDEEVELLRSLDARAHQMRTRGRAV